MAGNFILKSITQSDFLVATRFPNISWSQSTAHKKGDLINPNSPNGPRFKGWAPETRKVLSHALSNRNIGNREELPPHRYLMIKSWNILSNGEQEYIKGAGWVESLEYPESEGLGLKALQHSAKLKWGMKRKDEALIEMLKVGGVSIEVYYQSGLEMY